MKMPDMFTVIPEGMRAQVTSGKGNRKIVDGPCRVPFWQQVLFFQKFVIAEGDCYTITDDSGVQSESSGPNVIHVHPLGHIQQHARIDLAAHEAVVIIREDGKRQPPRPKGPDGYALMAYLSSWLGRQCNQYSSY